MKFANMKSTKKPNFINLGLNLGLIILLCLTFGLYGFSPGCGGEKEDDDSPKMHHVTYVVNNWDRAKLYISYQNISEGSHTVSTDDYWSFSFDAEEGTFLYLWASASVFNSGSFSLQIQLDGKSFKSESCYSSECDDLSIAGYV